MIEFSTFKLENGLRVIHHLDNSTQLVCLNILYDVGARDENPDKTGFAHLFEHLMFGGSVNIPSYDEPLQRVGGENNAFTNNDFTNYYIQVPAVNIETAFWLESDRMLSLAFSEKSLEVQRNVVIEEFKQRYLNQPYGDVWLKLKPLAYQVHPYQWATIGKEISHIENAKIADVKAFFAKHYNPSNAVLVVAGAVTLAEVKSLCDKWFSPIPAGIKYERNLPDEPIQLAERSLKVFAKVPTDAIYKAFHIDSRLSGLYNTADLISDILSRGESSRLYQSLVKNKRIFSEINAYISGDIEPGLLIVEGKLMPGISMEQADESIWIALDEMKTDTVPVREMQKNINKLVSAFVFGEMSLLNKAMNLAYYELLGDANLINVELEQYQKITVEAIQAYAKQIFRKENCATLYYHSQN